MTTANAVLQHVNVKLFVEEPEKVNLQDAIPVFHGWIQKQGMDELLLDVADYRHVPAGPGVLLIGHEGNYSLDLRQGRIGLLYNRKAPVEGAPGEVLRQAVRAAAQAAVRLEEEAQFKGRLRFRGDRIEIVVNDRLLAPNLQETFEALKPELEALFTSLFEGPYTLSLPSDPRERFGVVAEAEKGASIRGWV